MGLAHDWANVKLHKWDEYITKLCLARCVVASIPAILANVVPEKALALGSAEGLRQALRSAGGESSLDRAVEVAVTDRGGTFFGDDLRREATSMPLRDFLALLDHSEESFEGREDFYLAQCPFLRSQSEGDPSAAPLAELASALSPPAFLPGAAAPSSEDSSSAGAALGSVSGNLWACPRAASTNPHFDSRHNCLMVLSGSKTVTLWSPAETRRHRAGINAISAAHAGVAEAVAAEEGAGATGRGNREWPALSLLGANEGAGTTVRVPAGSALFIPEGWWHQVESEARTVAVNYWFGGDREAITSKRPHAAQYIVRTLAAEMLQQARTSLVRAARSQCRAHKPVAKKKDGDDFMEIDFSSPSSIVEALASDPESTIGTIGRHMKVFYPIYTAAKNKHQ